MRSLYRLSPIVFTLLALPLGGCCWLGNLTCADCRKPDPYGQVAVAVLTAGHALEAKHHFCFPVDYGRAQFFRDLADQPMSEDALGYLHLAEIDVWTDADCMGYVLVAHRPGGKDVMLWDLSKSTSLIDGQAKDGKAPGPVPPRTPPTGRSR